MSTPLVLVGEEDLFTWEGQNHRGRCVPVRHEVRSLNGQDGFVFRVLGKGCAPWL